MRLILGLALECGLREQELMHLECREWTLHKFRRTYCTSLLRSGVNRRTVQAPIGHGDIESTMRYLRPAENVEIQDRINKISRS